MIGFPAGDSGLEITQAGSKSFKGGSVNGTGRKRVIDGATRTELVELDALARGGNSGSPVFEVDGDVVGLLSAGPADDDDARARFAVNSEVAEPLIEEWTSADPVQPADCTGSVGPDGQPVPFEALPGGEAAEVAATLNLYFHSTNQADYETAYAQLHPAAQSERGLKAFSKGVRTSKDSDIQYRSVRGAGRDLVVWTTFRSEQQPQYGPEGLSCALWSLDYTMRQSDGLWLIARSAPRDGQSRYTDCVGQ